MELPAVWVEKEKKESDLTKIVIIVAFIVILLVFTPAGDWVKDLVGGLCVGATEWLFKQMLS